MDPITAIAASGMRARMESLDLLANNLANASTSGYKADREFYSLYVAPEAQEEDPSSTMPLIERPWTDLSEGAAQPTGNPLDLALSGRGFFAVDTPGGPLYTRNGGLHLDAAGTLVTVEGHPVRSVAGAPITLAPSAPIEISPDGTIRQNGAAAGRIAVADFPSGGLVKQGNNYFRPTDPSATPAAATGAVVAQGRLEASNTGSAESAVRLIQVMRQFEMLQKAVGLAGEMDAKAVQEVAKVG
ncbi:MAG: flagellar basal-body rod protein FlgF [Acidobacteriia bacterium]|nr:flagellar basal-body rod protein FlgF [Terriglobia bacterium]